MKNVQISYELYQMLLDYHLNGNTDNWMKIRKELAKKEEKRELHELYTESKEAPTDEEKEEARQEYLDRAGIRESFRW